MYTVRPKNCPVLFLQFCQGFLYSNSYYYTYTLINLEQNDIKIINLLWRASLYCLVKCSMRTRAISKVVSSHKLERHHYFLEQLNKTSSKVWKCMEQQCSALAKHIIKCFSMLSATVRMTLSALIITDQSVDQWPSAGCLTNCHSDVASTHNYLALNFISSSPIALPRFCKLHTKFWNVRMSQVWSYNWSPASRDKAARWLCVHGALTGCTFKT